ncbi:MAG TPA: hypothetical protein VFF11_02055 [Candidatus Binatia bacterium]|nr:hypothetical protein [Candidatus Binatia bacterium]
MNADQINDKSVVVVGRLLKTLRLRDEYYEPLDAPARFVAAVQAGRTGADFLTFVQEINDPTPRCPFHHEYDHLAVLPLSTYEHWANHQISAKAKNKLRKAVKNGVEARLVEFNDELVRAIMSVYNECPVRQGQPNHHFGKDFATVKREHATFLDRSDFIAAFCRGEIVGFAKVTHVKETSVFMNILSMVSQRDKAPTNALMAKTVEICTARNSRFLNYSTWGRREGLNEFKESQGFQRFEIPRYFVPLTLKGKIALKLRLHRNPADYLPAGWVERALKLQSRWVGFRSRHNTFGRSVKAMATAK